MKILLIPDPTAPNGEDAFCREFAALARQRGHQTVVQPLLQDVPADKLAANFSHGFAQEAPVVLINGIQPGIFQAAKAAGKKVILRLIETGNGKDLSGDTVRSMALASERVLVPSRHLVSVVKSWGGNGNIRYVPYAYDRIMAGQIALLTPQGSHSAAFPMVVCTALDESSRPGLETLFSALARLRLDYHLSLLGDGPLREFLRDRARDLLISDRVSFLGNLAPGRIGEYLRSARVYVDPCGLDAFPNWALQAMAAGCPVIAVSLGALPEVIRHEHNGLCFPQGDASALAEAIVTLYSLRGLSNRLIAEGVKTVKNHDWPSTASAALSAAEDLA